jgi:hypothetical protein
MLLICHTGFSQDITKSKAKRIAKNDTTVHIAIAQINEVKPFNDWETNQKCWLVFESWKSANKRRVNYCDNPGRHVWKIDLKSGEVVKRYFESPRSLRCPSF